MNRSSTLLLNTSTLTGYDQFVNNLSGFSTVYTSPHGSLTNWRSKITFRVNLKTLLGDLYDKYDYFNIEVAQFMSLYQSIGGFPFFAQNVAENRLVTMWLSGLKFVNSSYNVTSNCNKRYGYLCNPLNGFLLTTNANNNINYIRSSLDWINYSQESYLGSNLKFQKEENIELMITFGTISDEYEITFANAGGTWSGYSYPNFVLKLLITPAV